MRSRSIATERVLGLIRVAGLAEELSELLQVRVDVVADELLRVPVSASAHADAVPL